MQVKQQLNNNGKVFCRATSQQRVLAGLIFLILAATFGFLWLAGKGKIDLGFWLGPCGFKQRFGLPCPTCGMTTSAIAFAQGKILEAFYIQPAAGLFCCVLVIITVLSLFTAISGVYFAFLKRLFAELKIKYIILLVLVVIAAGWAVTLARALAENK